MSNALNVRRVMIQDLDKEGKPIGEPCYGVLAFDEYDSGFNTGFPSIEALNVAIEEKGCIAHLLQEFEQDADPSKVGTDNFYGYNWKYGDQDEDDEDDEDLILDDNKKNVFVDLERLRNYEDEMFGFAKGQQVQRGEIPKIDNW